MKRANTMNQLGKRAGEMFFEVEEYYHRNNDEREKGKEKK